MKKFFFCICAAISCGVFILPLAASAAPIVDKTVTVSPVGDGSFSISIASSDIDNCGTDTLVSFGLVGGSTGSIWTAPQLPSASTTVYAFPAPSTSYSVLVERCSGTASTTGRLAWPGQQKYLETRTAFDPLFTTGVGATSSTTIFDNTTSTFTNYTVIQKDFPIIGNNLTSSFDLVPAGSGLSVCGVTMPMLRHYDDVGSAFGIVFSFAGKSNELGASAVLDSGTYNPFYDFSSSLVTKTFSPCINITATSTMTLSGDWYQLGDGKRYTFFTEQGAASGILAQHGSEAIPMLKILGAASPRNDFRFTNDELNNGFYTSTTYAFTDTFGTNGLCTRLMATTTILGVPISFPTGAGVVDCAGDIARYILFPTQDVTGEFQSALSNLSTRVPFGWFSQASAVFSGLDENNSTTSTDLTFTVPLNETHNTTVVIYSASATEAIIPADTRTLVKTTIAVILWALFFWWLISLAMNHNQL